MSLFYSPARIFLSGGDIDDSNVSANLALARVERGLSMPKLAVMAGVLVDDVFNAENFLEDVNTVDLRLIVKALGVDVVKLIMPQ